MRAFLRSPKGRKNERKTPRIPDQDSQAARHRAGARVRRADHRDRPARAIATSGRNYDEDAKSPAAVAKRIKPVAEINLGAAGPAASGSTVQAAAKADGRTVYESTCMACHGAGVANAPKFGDKKAWATHLVHGTEHVYENALKGKGAMPPKGGNLTLSEAEVKAAVDYMLQAVK